MNIIGEELVLLSSTIASSTKLKTFFNNPTYAESQKLEVLLTNVYNKALNIYDAETGQLINRPES